MQDNLYMNIINNISNKATKPESEYMGEDGLLHCSACHGAVQTVIHVFGKERVVRCICKCRENQLKAEEEQRKKELHERRRRQCFGDDVIEMSTWTFANDDRHNPKLSDAMMRYVEQFDTFRDDGKGLLLHGTVGTGKSFLAACIANELIDRGYIVKMTNLSTIVNELQGMFDGKQEYINRLNKCSLLIIDDLGIERNTEYMKEMVYNVIDSRYRSGLPFIVTTNLTPDEIKKPQEIGYQRIYDRVLERCFPIAIEGVSRRRQALKQSYNETKDMLGL